VPPALSDRKEVDMPRKREENGKYQWTHDGSCPDGCTWDDANPKDPFVPFGMTDEKPKPVKKRKPKKDSAAFLKRFRAEVERRTEILTREHEAIHKALGVKPGAKRISAKKREQIAAHVHKFAFTSEQIRKEISK